MRFLADMGVAVPIVEELRRQGHDALHLRDEGLQRNPDQQILDKAIAEDRILLTFDLDFGELAALARDQVVSVTLFRLSNARMANVALRLAAVLDASADALRTGAIVVALDPSSGRPGRGGLGHPVSTTNARRPSFPLQSVEFVRQSARQRRESQSSPADLQGCGRPDHTAGRD